ncbi:hypothetical protein ASPVEDRAFT_82490 [Aspergillus versicolor CBS 583.65]|uniref:DUF4038 domain-containing protein n=1 Tax=Aspergillus versicolor CBS 583.65 TaxID=1036611 RepID=A0A1L9PHE5_ASPVE|nr:uncharacterized protein ASPVEDRAFT_82490 [Aspergillus versicolor CBS 583.65]OJJ00939.1 hypothetical protein ASPVEDRAFT_82490 [Aspergillus versicolor CBS 583.65]
MLKAQVFGIALAILQSAKAWQIPAEYALTPSSNGRFLQQANGDPFFWQADTAWLLFHRLNYSEADAFLSDRSEKGFNMVLAVAFTQAGIDNPNRNGDLPFIDEDVTDPNEPYWEHVDSVVKLAWTKGIRICMVSSWGKFVHDSDNNGDVLNSTTAHPFGKFLGQRYPYLPKTLVGDTNPYWQNKTAVKADYAYGGVLPPYEVTDWSPVYDDLANGIVAGERQAIKASSGHKSNTTWWPLMTIHPTNQWFTGGPLALAHDFFGDREWLTLDASQSGHADYPPNPPIPWWNCRRGWEPVEIMYAAGSKDGNKIRPVIDNEPHYENRYNNGKDTNAVWNASDVRVGSWQAVSTPLLPLGVPLIAGIEICLLEQVFSGAAGLTYGANAIQQCIIPGLFDSDGSGPSDDWSTDLELPGSGQMQFIQKAVLDRGNGTAYFHRVPAQDIIVGDAGVNDARVTATRDRGGNWIMVYTPTGEPFQIDTQSVKSCSVRASWYSPLSGRYTRFDYTQCGDSAGSAESRTFTPPAGDGHSDWALVLEVVN